MAGGGGRLTLVCDFFDEDDEGLVAEGGEGGLGADEDGAAAVGFDGHDVAVAAVFELGVDDDEDAFFVVHFDFMDGAFDDDAELGHGLGE